MPPAVVPGLTLTVPAEESAAVGSLDTQASNALFAPLDAEEEVSQLLFFDARSNRFWRTAKSPATFGCLAFLIICHLYGVGFLSALCLLGVVVIVAARFIPLLSDEEPDFDYLALDLLQFLLYSFNYVGRNYVHSALYLLDVDLSFYVILLACLLCKI